MRVEDVPVGTGPTPVLSASDQRSTPPILYNAGGEDIALTFGSDTDSFALTPGRAIEANAYQDCSATVAAGTELLQILEGIIPIAPLPAPAGDSVDHETDIFTVGAGMILGAGVAIALSGSSGGDSLLTSIKSGGRNYMSVGLGTNHNYVLALVQRAFTAVAQPIPLQTHPTYAIFSVDSPVTKPDARSQFAWNHWRQGGDFGAYLGIRSITEEVTIAVGQGAGGVATTISVPANSRILDAAARVTQAPGGGATTLDVGRTAGDLDELIDGISTALDTTGTSVANHGPGVVFPLENPTANTLDLTTDANVTVSDMIARVTVWYREITPPTG